MLTQHCFEGEAVSCTFSETVPGKVSQNLSEGLYACCNSACYKDTLCSAALHPIVIAHDRRVTANHTFYAYPRTATQSLQNYSVTDMSSSLM